MLDAIRRFDAAITEVMFQPVQDWIASIRGRSDHWPAIAAFALSAVAYSVYHILGGPGRPMGLMLGINWFFMFIIGLYLWAYGHLYANSNRPGALATTRIVRVVLMLLPVPLFSIPYLLTHPTWAGMFSFIDDILGVFGFYLSACTLKKPPPPKPKEEFELAPVPVL